MLLLMGMIDLGRAVFAYNTITNSAREAARLAIVNQDEDDIRQRAADMSTSLAVTTTITWARPDGSSCGAVQKVIGCIATIEVETDYRPITPVLGTIIGPITFAAESQIGAEFSCPPVPAGMGDCPKQP
jgi:Flp pilus assembly protein TadG